MPTVCGLLQLDRPAGVHLDGSDLSPLLRGERDRILPVTAPVLLSRSTHFLAFSMVLAMMMLQMVLGIMTVIYIAPWHLAIVHQFGAVVLFTLILRARFLAQYPKVQSVRG